MKRRKRFLAGLLSLAMCLSLLPGTAWAATEWDGNTMPAVTSITINGKTFEADEYGNVIIPSSQMSKEDVEEKISSATVSTVPGTMAFSYNNLSDAKKSLVTYSLLFPGGSNAGDPSYSDWPYDGFEIGNSGGVEGFYKTDFVEAEPASDEDIAYLIKYQYENANMTGVWKYLVTPYDPDDTPDYDRYVTSPDGYRVAESYGEGDNLYQPYASVCYVIWKDDGGAAQEGEWDGNTMPAVTSITINGKTFEADEYGNVIIPSSQMSKEDVEEKISSATVSTVPGTMAFSYNNLSDAKKSLVTYSLLFPGGSNAGDPSYSDWPYDGFEIGNSGGVEGFYKTDFVEAEPASDEDIAYLIKYQYENANMTGVWKYLVTPYDPDDTPDYDKYVTSPDGYRVAASYEEGDNLYQPYASVCYVICKDDDAGTSDWSITSVNTERVSLYERYAGSGDIIVYTEDAPANAKLDVEEVADANGTEKETPTTGLTFGEVGPISNGAATFTVNTTTETPAGTYYFKVSDEAGTISCVGSFQVTKTYEVHLAVSPEAVAEEWTMYARLGSDIAEVSGTVYLPEAVADEWGVYQGPSLPIKNNEGTMYSLKDHPTEGETYGGTVYLLDHYEVTKNGSPCEDVQLNNGTPLHNLKEERDFFGERSFLMPAFGDFTITAVFAEAYQVDLGDLEDDVGYYTFYEWFRKGDTVDLSNIVSNANKTAEESGQVVDKVTVYKTGEPSTVVATFEPEGQYPTCNFTMPEYGVSVDVTYTKDTVARLESVGQQADLLIARNSGTTTIEVTTGNIADGTELTISPCGITGTETTVEGLTLSISPVQGNKATITVTTTEAIQEDTYYFKLSTQDGVALEYRLPYHGSITVSPATTKTIRMGAQVGQLTAGTAGTATFAGTVTNIADETSVTVQETNAAGTPQTVGATKGLTLSATEIKEGTFTVTAAITAEVPAGSYYFKATAGGETSQVVTITVGSKEAQTYQVTIQTSQNGTVTANKTTVPVGEQVTLTISPGTGYALDTISVTQTGGGSVTLSGTGNTRAFTMPAADVTVSAVFKEDTGSGTKYLVNSQTYQNGYVSISKQSAAEGETVTLTATPSQGYVLASISVTKDDGGSVALSGTGNTRTFTMPASNVTVNATFAEEGETFPVKVSTVPGGTITVTPTQARQGETVTVTVTPDSGMRMVSGSLKYSEAAAGGAVVTISGNTFTMPGIEVSVSCQFEKIPSGTDSQVQITSFIINGVSAAINNESRVITIVLPYGTDLSNVAPVISGANIKSISPASAQRVDLRYPRTYTVYGTDGTTVTYTVSAYTEQATPAIQLWEKLQDHIYSTENWWELAEYQKVTGYYGDYGAAQNLSSLREYMEDVTAQYGTRRASLNYYYTGGRLILEPSSYSMSGTSYKNTLDFPRRVLTNLNNLGYSVVTYNLRELQIDIYKTMETTSGFEITVSAPSSTIRTAWNKLSGSGQLFEIKASSTRSGLVLRIPVGDLEKSDLSLMKYDYTRAKFVEVDRDTWSISNGYLITNKVSAGIYGLRDR